MPLHTFTVRSGLAFAILVTMAAAPASSCPFANLLTCPIGSKQLQVCGDPDGITYSYGPPGAPELVLGNTITDPGVTPWPGVGRAIWENVTFQNGDVTYEVWMSFDRMDEAAEIEAGVSVYRSGASIADLQCDAGRVQGSVFGFSDFLQDNGQCWDFDGRFWRACP